MKKLRYVLIACLIALASLSLTACTFNLVGGPSAYDVAVKNGFQGTEEEWLQSLKGETGPAGEQGEAGSTTVIQSLYEEAVEVVLQTKKASASYLQRRLSIGYNRAARLIEEMEVF